MGTCYQFFIVVHVFGFIHCDYDCLCTYSVETPVYDKPSLTSNVYGRMYEFDCKPLYRGDPQLGFTGFHAVQFSHKVVYVKRESSTLEQVCQGSVPSTDLAVMAPEVTHTSTAKLVSTNGTIKTTIKSTVNHTPIPPFTTKLSSTTSTSSTISTTSTSLSTSPSASSRKPEKTSQTSALPVTPFASIVTSPPTGSVSTVSLIGRLSTYDNHVYSDTRTKSTLSAPSTTLSTSSQRDTKTTNYMTSSSRPFTTAITNVTTLTKLTQKLSRTVTVTQQMTTNRMSTTSKRTASTLQSSTIASSTPQPTCPPGWLMFRSSCYKFHTNHRTTWDQANMDCVSQKAHIVFVESTEEQHFLQNYLSNHLDLHTNDNSDTGTWIGATDIDKEGVWVWRDSYRQTDVHLTYTHWRHDEPDSSDQDCAGMIGRQNFEWMDYECSQKMFCVCEMSLTASKININKPTVAVSKQPDCESEWIPYQTSCYRFVTDHGRLEWDPAYKFCERINSHLVIIETQEEDRFLRDQMRERIDTDNDNDEETGVWTAGTDQDVEDRWVWRNSLRHTDTPISGYKNWYPGEPDSGDHDKDEDCLCLIGNKGFQWQDYRCKDNVYFICEKPRSESVGTMFVGR